MDLAREFYSINQIQLQTRGRGSKNPKIFWISYLETPNAARTRPTVSSEADFDAAAAAQVEPVVED